MLALLQILLHLYSKIDRPGLHWCALVNSEVVSCFLQRVTMQTSSGVDDLAFGICCHAGIENTTSCLGRDGLTCQIQIHLIHLVVMTCYGLFCVKDIAFMFKCIVVEKIFMHLIIIRLFLHLMC